MAKKKKQVPAVMANCFYCFQDKLCTAMSLKEAPLPAVMEKYRHHGVVTCADCWKIPAGERALMLYQFAVAEAIASN